MLDTLLSISPLFILIALGRLLYHYKVCDINWVQVFNAFTLKIGFPALIFTAIYQSKKEISDYSSISIYNSAFIILIFCLGLIFFRKMKDKRTFMICLIFNNIAFLGIPIIQRIYGNDSVGETGIIASIYLFWVFTLGIIYLEISRKYKVNLFDLIKNLSTNPLLLAIILGFFFQTTHLQLPKVINESIELIAQSVTPIVLLSIGIFIGTITFDKKSELIPVFAFSVLTLAITPAILFFASKFSMTNLQFSIMEAAMPVAVAPFAMADSFGLNKKLIAQLILISTVISAFSLSIWHLILS